MPKDRYRLSKSERSRKVVADRRSVSPPDIRKLFLQGNLTPGKAIDKLSATNNSFGLLWAAEIALENALTEQNIDRATDRLVNARVLLRRAEAQRAAAIGGKIDALIARARFLDTHIPAFSFLALHRRLPPAEIAEGAHANTLQIARTLADEMANTPGPSMPHMNGFLGILDVYSLLERRSLTVGSEKFFPYLANLSPSAILYDGNREEHLWHLGQYKLSANQKAVLGRKILTRTSQFGGQAPDSGDVAIVTLSPDLKVRPHEPNSLTRRIVQECYDEYFGDKPDDRLTQIIDRRTEQLLEIIGVDAS